MGIEGGSEFPKCMKNSSGPRGSVCASVELMLGVIVSKASLPPLMVVLHKDAACQNAPSTWTPSHLLTNDCGRARRPKRVTHLFLPLVQVDNVKILKGMRQLTRLLHNCSPNYEGLEPQTVLLFFTFCGLGMKNKSFKKGSCFLTGTLWNLSSHDSVKMEIVDHALHALSDEVLVPHSGWERGSNGAGGGEENCKPRHLEWETALTNTAGCLRYEQRGDEQGGGFSLTTDPMIRAEGRRCSSIRANHKWRACLTTGSSCPCLSDFMQFYGNSLSSEPRGR